MHKLSDRAILGGFRVINLRELFRGAVFGSFRVINLRELFRGAVFSIEWRVDRLRRVCIRLI